MGIVKMIGDKPVVGKFEKVSKETYRKSLLDISSAKAMSCCACASMQPQMRCSVSFIKNPRISMKKVGKFSIPQDKTSCKAKKKAYNRRILR